jgi:uncharacterized membrane protein YhaH (DUF805 family)
MTFIATYWWVWLILTFVCYGYAAFNQISRITNMQKFDGNFDNFTKGLASMVVAALLGSVFTILAIIGVIIQLIDYAKG